MLNIFAPIFNGLQTAEPSRGYNNINHPQKLCNIVIIFGKKSDLLSISDKQQIICQSKSKIIFPTLIKIHTLDLIVIIVKAYYHKKDINYI